MILEPSDAARLTLATRIEKVLAVVTLLAGVLVGTAVAVSFPPSQRTFLAISQPVQSVLSIFVPFLAVLLVSGLPRE